MSSPIQLRVLWLIRDHIAKKVPARKFKYYVVNTEEEFGVTVEKTMVEEVEAVPKGVV